MSVADFEQKVQAHLVVQSAEAQANKAWEGAKEYLTQDVNKWISPLQALCQDKKVTIVCKESNKTCPWDGKWGLKVRAWRVTLKYQGRQLTTDFFQGAAHAKPPTAADVLGCLCADASAGTESFEGFCSAMGYSEDSRQAEKGWKWCVKMAQRLPRFLGADFNEFCNTEH